MPKKQGLSGRVWLLDELRGLFIILMVLYHLCYDLVYIFGVRSTLLDLWLVTWIQLFIAGMFVFLSGIVCHYSRGNVKRGFLCFCLGMLMTLGTYRFLPTQIVKFGVLHFLGLAMILFPLLWKLLHRVPPWLGLVACALLFFLTYNTQSGYWGMRGWELPLPQALYSTSFLFPLGFPSASFWSSDYFPLLPWLFWFLGGVFAGVYVRSGKLPSWTYRPHARWLALVGRNTIIIYLLHQPILYGVLLLIFNAMQ